MERIIIAAADKKKKKSMGRQKIEIKKIENKNSLQVTFSKRRKGLIKKAGELSILCGADVAVIVQSPFGKIHAFGNVPVESIMDRYLNHHNNYYKAEQDDDHDENENKCLEILKKLEAEKNDVVERSSTWWWWNQPFDDLDLVELEQFTNSMEVLKNNVMAAAAARTNNNNDDDDVLIPNMAVDCFGGAPVPHYSAADFISSSSTISKPLILFNPTPST